MNYFRFLALLVLCCFFENIKAQESVDPAVPYFAYDKGFEIISPDNNYTMNIRFRMQNRFGLSSRTARDLRIDEVEARVRRLRLRFDGRIYSDKLTYVIQLSFARGDIDGDPTGQPNLVRDAMAFYKVNEHWTLGLGQTKLPGNRQRVNSSGDLQFTDRSLVNAAFNIDRDFGFQVLYRNEILRIPLLARGALSTGEGRNITISNAGMAYTGRLELYPLGLFTNGGDYFEGDLEREQKPKIALGGTYSYNQQATRTGGQLGGYLFGTSDISTFMLDFLLKYNGFAFASEYVNRNASNIVTYSDDSTQTSYVYVGEGFNFQGSYLFQNNYEIALRYTELRPLNNIRAFENKREEIGIAITKYLRGHRVKFQTEIAYQSERGAQSNFKNLDQWLGRIQIELGI